MVLMPDGLIERIIIMKYWELKQILYENHVDIIQTVHDEYGHEIHTKDVVYCFNTDWERTITFYP